METIIIFKNTIANKSTARQPRAATPRKGSTARGVRQCDRSQ
jgi:hypothetical protein